MQPLNAHLPRAIGPTPQIRSGVAAGDSQARGLESPTSPGEKTQGDQVSLSAEGLRAISAQQEEEQQNSAAPEEESKASAPGKPELTEEQRAQVRELQARDAEVRAHEQAHKAAAGNLASGAPSYEYEKGPDGRDYAVAGEVGISIREGKTPQETLANAQRVQRAAQAPASPSSQDRAVAAQAAQQATEARSEIQAQRSSEQGQADPAGSERVASATGSNEEARGATGVQSRSAYTDTQEQIQATTSVGLIDLIA